MFVLSQIIKNSNAPPWNSAAQRPLWPQWASQRQNNVGTAVMSGLLVVCRQLGASSTRSNECKSGLVALQASRGSRVSNVARAFDAV